MDKEKTKTGLALLREPFPEHQISKMCRSTKKDNPRGRCEKCKGYHGLPAVQLSYIGHAALTDRLLDADPNWSWEPLALDERGVPVVDSDGGMWIRLTVCGVTRLGYGDNQNRQGGDGVKERIGDALRNAAMRFGAGLELWHKGDLHLEEAEKQETSEKTANERILGAMQDKKTEEKQELKKETAQKKKEEKKASDKAEPQKQEEVASEGPRRPRDVAPSDAQGEAFVPLPAIRALWASMTAKGIKEDELRTLLKKKGINSSKEIPVSLYDGIRKELGV